MMAGRVMSEERAFGRFKFSQKHSTSLIKSLHNGGIEERHIFLMQSHPCGGADTAYSTILQRMRTSRSSVSRDRR